MATGIAKGAAARGRRIAFGDGKQIIWDYNSEQIFRDNKNVAPPGSEKDNDIEWVAFHRGNRQYALHDAIFNRWVWNYSFRPTPGEFFFSDEELKFAEGIGKDFIIVEPNVPSWKTCAPNKQWRPKRFEEVTNTLIADGHEIIQLIHGERHNVAGARKVKAPSFRHAAAVVARAKAAVLPEGGLHHAAAAVDTKAVVIFGGFIPPEVTGYDFHVNISAGKRACGSLFKCGHCEAAMDAISVEFVYQSVRRCLG